MDDQGDAVMRENVLMKGITVYAPLYVERCFVGVPGGRVNESMLAPFSPGVGSLTGKFLFEFSHEFDRSRVCFHVETFIQIAQDRIVKRLKSDGCQKDSHSGFPGQPQRLTQLDFFFVMLTFINKGLWFLQNFGSFQQGVSSKKRRRNRHDGIG